ncbi:MAG TPA: biopolymer transporter TolR [Spirochaetia bacterium]|nr:biopolymer transporter TolR [Spirochaetia bacterium]
MNTTEHNHALGLFEDQTDVGSVELGGSCDYDAERGRYTIAGSGRNIWDDHDDFHFVWRRMRGDFIVTARAVFPGAGVDAHRKLGWMARTSLETDSPHVSTGIHGDGLLSLQYRPRAGAQTEEVKAALAGADVVQLERRGRAWIMSVARFGEPFVSVQVDDTDPGDEVYLGLFVCSHNDGVLERAAFDNVRIVVPAKDGFDRASDPFGSHLEVLDVSSGDRSIVYSDDHVFEAPNWTRDGEALIYNQDGRLYRFDLATRTPSRIDTGEVVHNNNDHVLSFDGTMLAMSSHSEPDGGSVVYTVPVEGGRPQRVTPAAPSYLHGWSPDGKSVVYTGRRNGQFDIYRIATDGGDEEQLTSAEGLDDGPEYTPDGEYIYFNSVRSGLMQIWRMKPDGSDPEQLTDDEYNNWFPHISPDGQWVVFVTYLVGEVDPSDHPAAKRVYLRMIPCNGGEPRVIAYLYGGQGTMNVPSWSPDGRKIAFVSNTVPFR